MNRTFLSFLFSVIISAVAENSVMSIELWNNGPLSTGPVTQSDGSGGPGVTAPTGTTWSEVPDDGVFPGGFANNAIGWRVDAPDWRLSDSFSITEAPGWQIDSLRVWAYQTGGTTSCTNFDALNLRIWDARPGDAGSNVVFGDTTTNRLVSSSFSDIYRTPNTRIGGVPPGDGTPPDTMRPICALEGSVGAILPPGDYWLDWQINGTLATGPFAPSVTITGIRSTPGANGRQFNGNTNAWEDIIDTASPAAGPDLPQDIPFVIVGNVLPEPKSLALFLIMSLLLIRRSQHSAP